MPPCHQYSHTHFLNMFRKAARFGLLQNRPLQTASYLAETLAGNREGNKLTLPHQQPLLLALAVLAYLRLLLHDCLGPPPASAPCFCKVS